jgi:hypothetical protein
MLVAGVAIFAALIAVRGPAHGAADQERLFLAYATPVAVAAMVTVCLAELPFAAIVAVVVGLFAAIVGASATELAGADFTGSLEAFELALAYVVSGLVGAVTLHRADRLSRFALSALTVSVALGAVLTAFWLVSEPRDTGHLPDPPRLRDQRHARRGHHCGLLRRAPPRLRGHHASSAHGAHPG